MKEGWQTKPFEDCIESVKYTRKIQRKDFLNAGHYPIVSHEADFTNGYWDDEADVFKVTTPVVIFGDHTQVLKYVDFDFVLGADGVKILPPRNFLYPKFFFYQLQAVNFTSLGYARHYRLLKEMEIKYPPLAEQQRIVGLLDEAFEGLATAKANAEKNLQNARALFESHLQAVFTQRGEGWMEKPLRVICDFSQGVQVDVKLQSDLRKDQSQVRFLRIVDFTQGNEPERFIDNPGEKFLVCQSDISLVRYGASTGFVCRGLEGAIANNLFRVIPKDGHVSNDFLYWFLKSPAFQDEIKEIMNGAAMPAISFGVINEIAVAFPPQRDQLAIVSKLESFAEETQRLARLYERKHAALEALKKSLLHQAFNGEL